jgi:hypothetical protein
MATDLKENIEEIKNIFKLYLNDKKLDEFIILLNKDFNIEDIEEILKKNHNIGLYAGIIWKYRLDKFFKNKIAFKFYKLALEIDRDKPESYKLSKNAFVEDGMCHLQRVGYIYESSY